MALDPELQRKIKKKKFDEVEQEWTTRAGADPREMNWFLEVAREIKAVKALPQMISMISDLADLLGADEAWEDAFDALREGIELAPRNKELRTKAVELFKVRYEERPDLDNVLGFFEIEEAEDGLRAFDEMRDWLRFRAGEGYWLFGRGLGKVAEVNLALQKVKLRFEKAAPLVVRRDEARKILTWIPPEHFMLRRLEEQDAVKKEARKDPGAFMRELLDAFGRPLTASEIKECMVGVVEGGAWTSWWAKARSHPQVLPNPRVKGGFMWSHSSEEASQVLLDEFGSANVIKRMELARKHGKRGGDVKAGIIRLLQEDLVDIAPSGNAVALELAYLLEELGGLPDPSPLDVDEALRGPDAAEKIAGVGERRFREKLYKRLRKVRPEDGLEVLRTAFFSETDLRLISTLYEVLIKDGDEDTPRKLVADTVSQPRNNPHTFVWLAKNVLVRDELLHRANHAMLTKVVEALDTPEFKELKASLREHFEEGGLAFAVFEGVDLDGADKLLTLIDGAAMEEHRKTSIRRAIFRKYPRIRKPMEKDEDVLWATADAAEDKRQELDQLVRVEIPETTEAVRVAREYGDLSENFEYHAARQKHEVLSTRATRLQKEIRKVRLIDPDKIDPSKVSIGTRVELESTDGGVGRELTILGPWESDPDRNIYSYQSEFAKELLGKEPGDDVHLEDREYRVARIHAWSPGSEPAPASPGAS